MYKVQFNADNEIFWNFCKEQKLMFQQCKKCGKIRWPYSIACPECYSFEYSYYQSSGKGKIYSYVIYNVAFDKFFKDKVPYVVAIILLENNVKFLSNIVKSNFNEIECEKEVEIFWEKYDNLYIPKFCLSKNYT